MGDVAQTGEHLLCKQGVSGSIPLISTKWDCLELIEQSTTISVVIFASIARFAL